MASIRGKIKWPGVKKRPSLVPLNSGLIRRGRKYKKVLVVDNDLKNEQTTIVQRRTPLGFILMDKYLVQKEFRVCLLC